MKDYFKFLAVCFVLGFLGSFMVRLIIDALNEPTIVACIEVNGSTPFPVVVCLTDEVQP